MQQAEDIDTEVSPPLSSGKEMQFTASSRSTIGDINEAGCDVEDAICALDLLIEGMESLDDYPDPARRGAMMARAAKALRGHMDGIFQRLLLAEASAVA